MELTKTTNNFNHPIFGGLTTITNENNDVFFISNEVSNILDYSANKKLLERMDEDEKVILKHEEAKALLRGVEIHSSGIQLITEGGLYSAILGSKKPEAKQFKKWVVSDVLPTIRKTGSYSVNIPTTYKDAILALGESLVREEQLQLKANTLEVKLDVLLDWVSIIKIAKHNKVKETAFNWRVLKSESKKLGYEIKKSESPRFGYQNLYHINCFKSAYPEFNYNIK